MRSVEDLKRTKMLSKRKPLPDCSSGTLVSCSHMGTNTLDSFASSSCWLQISGLLSFYNHMCQCFKINQSTSLNIYMYVHTVFSFPREPKTVFKNICWLLHVTLSSLRHLPASSHIHRFQRWAVGGSRVMGRRYLLPGGWLKTKCPSVFTLCLPPSSPSLDWGVRIRGREETER